MDKKILIKSRSTVLQPKDTGILILLLGVFFCCLISFVILLSPSSHSQPAQVLGTVAPAMTQNPTNYLHPSKPYYGVNVDMDQLVPGSSNYFKNSKGEDYIDIAHRLGITLFRIDNATSGFNTGTTYATYSSEQWNEVLNKMNRDGIKAVILIEAASNNPAWYQENMNSSYTDLVKQYVIDSNVGNSPDVIGIDLKNEPTLNANNLSYLSQGRNMIKQKYPSMPVCVGGWRVDTGRKDSGGNEQYNYGVPSDATRFSSIVDFYCVHIYGFDFKDSNGNYVEPQGYLSYYLNQLSKYTNNKPMLVEEFGASNGTTITDQQTLGSMQLQANTFDGVYQSILNNRNLGVIGSTAYLFSPRQNISDSWTIMSKDGNTLYPAAYVLQKYSLGHSDVSLSLPYKSLPTSNIYKNDNNYETEFVHVGDNIGFILNLPSGKQYVASVSDPSIAQISQPLSYSGSYKTFNSVVQLKKTGTVAFAIFNNPSCTLTSTGCQQNLVYLIAFEVQ